MHDLNIFFNSKYVPMVRGLRYNCPNLYFVSPGIFQIMQIFLENKEMGGVLRIRGLLHKQNYS